MSSDVHAATHENVPENAAAHSGSPAHETDPSSGIDPNLLTAYALWAVFRRPLGPIHRVGDDAVAELDAAVARAAEQGVTIRGFYDVSEPVWHAMAMHREAEFNKRHTPAFLRGKDPEAWITVYPFVRSFEWYLLPEEERSKMLRDHGMAGAKYRRVLTNTIATFALSDYEWILPLESPELVDLVDLMRDLRYTEARLHVREEVPFFTGRRVTTAELPEVLS